MAEVKRNVLEIPKRVIDVVWLLLYSLTLFALNDLFLVPGFNDGLSSIEIFYQVRISYIKQNKYGMEIGQRKKSDQIMYLKQ